MEDELVRISDFRLMISDWKPLPHSVLQSAIKNLQSAIAALAHHQHFPDIVASEEEFDGGKVAEEGFDVAVVENALQAEAFANGGVNGACGSAAGFAAQDDGLHFE